MIGMCERTIFMILTEFLIYEALAIFCLISGGMIELLNFIVSELTGWVVTMILAALDMGVGYFFGVASPITFVVVEVAAG